MCARDSYNKKQTVHGVRKLGLSVLFNICAKCQLAIQTLIYVLK